MKNVVNRASLGAKKNLNFSNKMKWLFVPLVLLTIGVGNAWGADQTVSWTATNGALGSSAPTSGTIYTGSYAWSYSRTLSSGESSTGYNDNSQGAIRMGKNGGVENISFTTSAIPGTIKSISVMCASYQAGHSLAISVGGTSYFSGATPAWGSGSLDTKTGTGTSSGTITISFTGGTRALYVKSISVTYNNDAPAADPYTVSFSTGTGNPTVSSRTEASGGAGITLPSVTPTCSGDGWALYGWATSACSSETSTAPAIVGKPGDSYKPAANNTTLYAVYAKGEYTKVTSTGNITSGGKYLVAGYDGEASWLMGNTYTYDDYYEAYYMSGTSISTPAPTTISASSIYPSWRYVITGSEGHYVIKDVADAKYVDVDYEDWYRTTSYSVDDYTITFSDGYCSIRNNYASKYLTVFDDGTFGRGTEAWAYMLIYKETTTPSYYSNPTCASCDANPSVGAASLNGTFSLSSIGVKMNDGTNTDVQTGCEWTDYGFVWGTSANPTVSDTKVQVGTSGTADTWSGSLTGSFTTGTTYYFRAYGKNGYSSGSYQYGTGSSIKMQKVVFNKNTGSGDNMSDQIVKYNTATALTSNSYTKTGHEFAGWATTSDGSVAYADGANITLTADQTLYAKWTAQEYTITKTFSNVTNSSLPSSFTYTGSTTTALNSSFSVDATNFFLPSSITVTMGGATLTAGTHYTYNSGTGEFTFDAVINGNIVITATATAKLKSIDITTQPTTRVYLAGETFSKTGAVVTATMGDGSTNAVTGSATWDLTTLSAGSSQTVTASYTEAGITKTATTTIDVYDVTVNKVDETGATITADGVSASATGRTLTASATSGSKYVFKGWKYGTAAGTSIASTSSASTSLTGTPTGDVTVIAEFYKPVTITWLKGGTTYETGSPTTSIAYGSQWKDLTIPTAPGDATLGACANKFMGWSNTMDVEWEADDHHTAPATLFTSVAGNTTVINADITFRAVFATQSGSSTEKTITINSSVLTSYASVDQTIGEITFKSTGKWGKQTYSTYSYVQGANGTTLYNDDAIPGYIKSITITPQPSGQHNNLTGHAQLAVGTTKQPTGYGSDITSESTTNYTSSNNYTYMQIYANGATPLASIGITYMENSYTYADYVTQCCAYKVAISDGTLSHCTLSYSSENQPTCGDASARQVTVTVTPDAGYEILSADGLEFDTDDEITATYISGPTGSGPYTFVYQFAQNDNGSGVFNATCTPKTYRITLNPNGGSGGTEYVDVVYNTAPANYTPPTKTDYNFRGYFTGSGGTGTQIGNIGGTWKPNITNWTSAGSVWIKAADVTLYAKWEEKPLKNYRTACTKLEIKNQDASDDADVHLTSYKDVTVYATEGSENLIRVIASNIDAIADLGGGTSEMQNIQIKYLDADDNEVTKANSPFRLCKYNDGGSHTDDYNYADGSNLNLNGLDNFDQTYSISYTPTVYGQIDHYKLQLRLQNNTSEWETKVIDLYGRSLPKEFAIVCQYEDAGDANDGKWYALPTNLATGSTAATAITPIEVEVDNTTTPTKVTSAPDNIIFMGCDRFRNSPTNTQFASIRFTADGSNHLEASSSENKMWMPTGNGVHQNFFLSSSDLVSYDVIWDPATSSPRQIGLYKSSGVKMGFYTGEYPKGRAIYFLPVDITELGSEIMEWGTDHVVISLANAGDAETVKTQIAGGTIGDAQTLTEIKKDAGIYRIDVTVAGSDASKNLKLYFYDDEDDLIARDEFVIPQLISSSDATTGSLSISKANAKLVDLVVLPDAVLTVSEITTGTKFTFRDLYVYGEGKMVVPTGTYIDFSNVYLRGGHMNADWVYQYSHPQLVLNGTMGNMSNTINYDYLTNNAQFYSLALPYDVTLSEIVNPDFNNKQSWLIHGYDGALRASGSQVNGWYDVEVGTTNIAPLTDADDLTAGVGYTFFGAPQKVNGVRQKWSVNRFPMTLASGSAEGEKAGVEVTAYGMTDGELDDGVAPNDACWNMIGNPYLADLGGDEDFENEAMVQGIILSSHNVKVMDGNGNWTGAWEWQDNETKVRYVRIPNDQGTEYTQERFKDATLKSFHHFFIQAMDDGTFSFSIGMRAQSVPLRFRKGKIIVPEEMDVDFRLTKGDDKTKFGLSLSDDFSTEFVVNEDMPEDLSGEAMKAYTLIDDKRVTFNGLPYSAAQQVIPVGLRAPEAGEYIFSYHEDENAEYMEHIYLTDKRLGIVTDLKESIYKFASEKGVIDDRFVLTIVFQSNVTTDIEGTFEQENGRPLKFIYQDKIYILRNGIIYDMTGKRVKEINK